MRLHLTPSAERDLGSIFDYSEESWGIEQAAAYLRDLHRAMDGLRHFPHMGRAADYLRPGIRLAATGSHIVVYRIGKDRIDIIRVLHRRMDIDKHL